MMVAIRLTRTCADSDSFFRDRVMGRRCQIFNFCEISKLKAGSFLALLIVWVGRIRLVKSEVRQRELGFSFRVQDYEVPSGYTFNRIFFSGFSVNIDEIKIFTHSRPTL